MLKPSSDMTGGRLFFARTKLPKPLSVPPLLAYIRSGDWEYNTGKSNTNGYTFIWQSGSGDTKTVAGRFAWSAGHLSNGSRYKGYGFYLRAKYSTTSHLSSLLLLYKERDVRR